MVTALLTTLFAAIFASIGYGFMELNKQNKRIAILESHRDVDIESIKELIKVRFDSVEGRLARIEKKQDKEGD